MEIKEYIRTAIKMFKFQLPVMKSQRYVDWLNSNYMDESTEIYLKEFHHVVGRKTTDYLGVMLTRSEHQDRHKRPTMYFIEDLLQAVKNLIKYVRELEDETK